METGNQRLCLQQRHSYISGIKKASVTIFFPLLLSSLFAWAGNLADSCSCCLLPFCSILCPAAAGGG